MHALSAVSGFQLQSPKVKSNPSLSQVGGSGGDWRSVLPNLSGFGRGVCPSIGWLLVAPVVLNLVLCCTSKRGSTDYWQQRPGPVRGDVGWARIPLSPQDQFLAIIRGGKTTTTIATRWMWRRRGWGWCVAYCVILHVRAHSVFVCSFLLFMQPLCDCMFCFVVSSFVCLPRVW